MFPQPYVIELELALVERRVEREGCDRDVVVRQRAIAERLEPHADQRCKALERAGVRAHERRRLEPDGPRLRRP